MSLQIFGKRKEYPENSKEKKTELKELDIPDKNRILRARIGNDLTVTMFNKYSRSMFTRYLENKYNNNEEFSIFKKEYTCVDAIEVLCPNYDVELVLNVWFWKNIYMFVNGHYYNDSFSIFASKLYVYVDDFRPFSSCKKFSVVKSTYIRELKDISTISVKKLNHKKDRIDVAEQNTRNVLSEISLKDNCNFLKNSFKIKLDK